MKKYKLLLIAALGVLLGNLPVHAQDGDQILDGIGETGLISRYVFDGNAKDWSRNNLHAKVIGAGVGFVKDERFGKVLSLPGKNAYVSLPGEALNAVESLSITGWIFLDSDEKGQRFFDFGKNESHHLYAAPRGIENRKVYEAAISKAKKKYQSVSKPIKTGQWVHLAVVFNTPSQSLSTYVNGELANKENQVDVLLEDVLGTTSDKNILNIGKALIGNKGYLNAKLHDFRIYRIPLNAKQVERVYRHNEKDGQQNDVARFKPENDLPQFSRTESQLYNEYLTDVSDVEVETTVGYLPRLPRFLEGTYSSGIDGPKVRVLWPEPTNNENVAQPGTYTITGTIPGSDLKPKATIVVKPGNGEVAPDRELETFPLDQVLLTQNTEGENTQFIENRNKFIDTLADTNPDSFLYMFRDAFGQKQPEGAEPLGVWDSQETKLRGHATGHYLSALAQAYASAAYDEELQKKFADKMDYMVNTLYKLSQMSGEPKKAGGEHVSDPTKVPPAAGKMNYDSDLSKEGIRNDYWNWGEGYISAYPPDQFIMLEKGATYGGQKTQVWAPYYTLHKILAGLMDIYEVSGNEKALEIAKGMGDWVYVRLSELPTETLISMWNRYIAGEFGGMNEAMARLYRITNEPRYLKTAQLFDNIKMFFGDENHSSGLAKNVDSFRGLHANQHIPQIVGALEMYRDSKNPEYFRIADNFWFKATNDYMYSIGGVAGARNPANAECFVAQPATLYENGFSEGGQNETCATYNMLKLTRHLFLYEQHPELMDYYERGLYNHILASVAEDSPANTYHVPLRAGSVKRFSNGDMSGFTCCNGTALESSTKLQNTIYFKSADNKALYVNLFIPSVLEWKQRNITIEQNTDFPKEDHTTLLIKGSGEFDLNVRVPSWATKGFFVTINGEKQELDAKPGSYLSISRDWKDGDKVELQMPFKFHLEPVMDQQNIASIFYGPILLAAEEGEPRKDWREIKLNAQDISKSIEGNPEKLRFQIGNIDLKPFYETYGRYSVYFDVNLEKNQ